MKTKGAWLANGRFLTIIPRARVGYEMIDSQGGALAPSWLKSSHIHRA